ncbi:hypothetical protein [Actinoplanes sp. NPDC051851]|uniref:hypothetical protein n=1 Tax=Actinoplanes sp. NPDC051851 TaxID=3154753 RepID=UPI003428BC37
MRRTVVLGIAVALSLAVTGCSETPEKVDGTAAPVGTPTSASAAPTVSLPATATTQTTTEPPATTTEPTAVTTATTSTSLVFGPVGWNGLNIGMTVAQAKATGQIKNYKATEGCAQSQLKGATGDDGTVIHSPTLGIIAIQAYGKMHTPEGIAIGSTVKQVKAAYPNLDDDILAEFGRAFATVSGSGDAHYRFEFNSSNKIENLWLEHESQNCYE